MKVKEMLKEVNYLSVITLKNPVNNNSAHFTVPDYVLHRHIYGLDDFLECEVFYVRATGKDELLIAAC